MEEAEKDICDRDEDKLNVLFDAMDLAVARRMGLEIVADDQERSSSVVSLHSVASMHDMDQ